MQSKNVKIQLNVSGYLAFVIERMMEVRGESLADVTKTLFDRWSAREEECYLERHGISLHDYEVWKGREKVVDGNFSKTDTS